jgi:hypothetical protein
VYFRTKLIDFSDEHALSSRSSVLLASWGNDNLGCKNVEGALGPHAGSEDMPEWTLSSSRIRDVTLRKIS